MSSIEMEEGEVKTGVDELHDIKRDFRDAFAAEPCQWRTSVSVATTLRAQISVVHWSWTSTVSLVQMDLSMVEEGVWVVRSIAYTALHRASSPTHSQRYRSQWDQSICARRQLPSP